MLKYKCPNCTEVAAEDGSTRATVIFRCDECGWKSGGMLRYKLSTSKRSDVATDSLSNKLARACVGHLSGVCCCSVDYTSRGMRDPSCEWCNIGQYIIPLAERLLA